MVTPPRLLKLTENWRPDVWIGIPPRQRPKSWNNIDGPVVNLERNLYAHPQAGLLRERRYGHACLYFTKSRFLRVGPCRRFLRWLGQTKTSDMWKSLKADIDSDDPKPIVLQVFFNCTQGEAKVNPQAQT